jgi:hypothetical protein
VLVQFRMNGPDTGKIIESMRSRPRYNGVLRLPKTISSVDLTMPDPAGDFVKAGHGVSASRATVAAVVQLLRDQTEVVPDSAACADSTQLTARLSLIPPEPSPAASSSASSRKNVGTFPVAGKQATTIIIALGTKCQEAVSSIGGRVRLSDTALAELESLLGIGDR